MNKCVYYIKKNDKKKEPTKLFGFFSGLLYTMEIKGMGQSTKVGQLQ